MSMYTFLHLSTLHELSDGDIVTRVEPQIVQLLAGVSAVARDDNEHLVFALVLRIRAHEAVVDAHLHRHAIAPCALVAYVHRARPVVHALKVEILFTRLEFGNQSLKACLGLGQVVHDRDVCVAVLPRSTLVDGGHSEAVLAHGDHACLLRAAAPEAKPTDLSRLSQRVVWHNLDAASHGAGNTAFARFELLSGEGHEAEPRIYYPDQGLCRGSLSHVMLL